jgi:hypothetical protein
MAAGHHPHSINACMQQAREEAIMAKEYLVALFARKRRVLINGQFMGTTNVKLELEGGTYEVTLGSPMNFTPEKHAVELRNTSSLTPMIVEFDEAGP